MTITFVYRGKEFMDFQVGFKPVQSSYVAARELTIETGGASQVQNLPVDPAEAGATPDANGDVAFTQITVPINAEFTLRLVEMDGSSPPIRSPEKVQTFTASNSLPLSKVPGDMTVTQIA